MTDIAAVTMEDLIQDFIEQRTWAVVGASTDPDKYGHRVLMNLRAVGYTVYPVNPKGGEIDGVQVCPTLADLPEIPDVVNVVVPPKVTEQIVRQMKGLGLSRVWLQPGAESEEVIRYCVENGIQVVYNSCAMVHRRRWN